MNKCEEAGCLMLVISNHNTRTLSLLSHFFVSYVDLVHSFDFTDRLTLQPLQQSPLLHMASWVSVHFLQQAPPLRAHSCSHRHENKPSALFRQTPHKACGAPKETEGTTHLQKSWLSCMRSNCVLTTWDPQSHSSPSSTKPFPHSGGSNS